MKKIKLIACGAALGMTLLFAPRVEAQQPGLPAPVPVPSQIGTATKVFISNAGDESDYFTAKNGEVKGGTDRPYNQFFAAMKSWGKYEIVGAPADADLVFEIHFVVRSGGGTNLLYPEFRLMIVDPRTRIVLWAITEYVEPANLEGNREKNFNMAMTALMSDLKSLGLQPAIVSGQGQQ
ncbi:MAG: hypothetical protein WAM91_16795 [Candidatus Acidiferrales bacterium]